MRQAAFGLIWAAAAAGQTPYFAVVEKVAGAVGFFTEDGRQVGRTKVGPFPHEAVLSADGRSLYVSVNGVLWMTEDATGNNTVAVVDVSTMRARTVDLGKFHRPHGIAVVPHSGDLLATTERPFALIRIDPVAGKVVRDFDVKGKSPHMAIPTADGEWSWVSDTDSGCVALIRLSSGETTTIATGERPQGAVLTKSGDRLYVANTNGNSISIVDTRARAVVGSIPTGKGPSRVALTPDGKTLVYNLQFEPAVGFADVASRRQTAVVPLSGRPLSLTMTRDGARAFAGIQDQDKVVYISVPKRSIERSIDLPKGSGPDTVVPLR